MELSHNQRQMLNEHRKRQAAENKKLAKEYFEEKYEITAKGAEEIGRKNISSMA